MVTVNANSYGSLVRYLATCTADVVIAQEAHHLDPNSVKFKAMRST